MASGIGAKSLLINSLAALAGQDIDNRLPPSLLTKTEPHDIWLDPGYQFTGKLCLEYICS
jgi:hypothetical protein